MTDVMWMKDVKSCDHLQLTKMLSFRTLILLEAFTVPIRFYSVWMSGVHLQFKVIF